MVLDNGLTSAFGTEKLEKQLGAKGQKAQLWLNTLDSVDKLTESSNVNLDVVNTDNGSVIELNTIFTKAGLKCVIIHESAILKGSKTNGITCHITLLLVFIFLKKKKKIN